MSGGSEPLPGIPEGLWEAGVNTEDSEKEQRWLSVPGGQQF